MVAMESESRRKKQKEKRTMLDHEGVMLQEQRHAFGVVLFSAALKTMSLAFDKQNIEIQEQGVGKLFYS